MNYRTLILVGLTLGTASCATPSPSSKDTPPPEGSRSITETQSQPQLGPTPSKRETSKALNSSIDIQYDLGRDHYRFHSSQENTSFSGSTFLNRQVLATGPIDADRYPDFLKKASAFVTQNNQNQKTLNSATLCRSPFIVTVQIEKEVQVARGCRSSDGGELSKLIRDGEFLLYSVN